MARKEKAMTVIRWKFFAVNAGAGLCATCAWGTVRKGFRAKEVETFCRIISPNGPVPFVVRDCTDYADRRVPAATEPEGRRYGFFTELSLKEEK
jgi:hypothetical protein